MDGIELLQTLINLYNEAVMNGVKSDSWTTKLDKLNLADSELVINEDEAIRQEFLEWVAMKHTDLISVPSVGYIMESALLMAMHNDAKYRNTNEETALEELAKAELSSMLISDQFVRVDKAYKGLCDVCFETTIKLLRFNALAELRNAVKDWSQDSGLIDTDIR
jgi:hypothetical protein